jgi:putative flippase GtrA
VLSKIIAVAVAIANNFIWNDLWTFRDASMFFQWLAIAADSFFAVQVWLAV